MWVAIPRHFDRVSPVFDVARTLLVVEIEGGRETGRRELWLRTEDVVARVTMVVHEGVDVLICAAISEPLEKALEAEGVEVLRNRCGVVEEILAAFCEDRQLDGKFLMPGCGCGKQVPGCQRGSEVAGVPRNQTQRSA